MRTRESTRELSRVPARRRHGKGARSHRLTHHGWRGSEASPDLADLFSRAPRVLVVVGLDRTVVIVRLAGSGDGCLARQAHPPDLVGSSMRVIEAYGSDARVEWIGRNQGPDATAGAWADYLYISPRSACCADAIFLGAFGWPQSAAVAPGATYTQEAAVHIPPLPLGNYYLIARLNASRSIAETNTANNDVAMPFRITSTCLQLL